MIRPKPFKDFGADTWTSFLRPVSSGDNPAAYALAGPNWEDSATYAPIPPPGSIMSPLFSAIADPQASPPPPPVVNNTATALGLSKAQFYAGVISEAEANNTVFQATESDNKYCAFPP